MPRPKNTDRDAVADQTLTVRFTKPERARLDVLLDQRLAALRGSGASINAGGLVRAIVVQHLDTLGIEAPAAGEAATPTAAAPTEPAQPTLPGLAAPVPASPAPFWYGISDAGSSVEWLQPRQASRDEMVTACRDTGLTLRGPFETRHAAWTAFDGEREEKEARAVAPPPPQAPQATATTEASSTPSSSPRPATSTPTRTSTTRSSSPRPATSTPKATATAQRPSKPASRTKKSAGKKPRR
jgi:hypothetical protein